MRKRLHFAISLGLALPAFSAFPLQAQTPATIDDLQCTAVLSLDMAGTKDPARKNGFMLGVFYFLGRIDGRDPGLDLETALRSAATEFQQLAPEQRRAAAARCGQLLVARGRVFNAAGRRLKASAQ